jgi:cytochrome oxidase assembly protein ShyY1
MRRGVPLVPTLMTAAALPVLVGLGVWQLQRAEWKAGILAELADNSSKPAATIEAGDDPERFQFRRVLLELGCDPPPPTVQAGRNGRGQAGYVVLVPCKWNDPTEVGEGHLLLNIGWGPRPDSWKSAAGAWPLNAVHKVEGVLVRRDGSPQWALVASEATPPLVPSAPPSLDTISNNHLSYAIQWFSFAAILAAIYAAFVVRWRRGR